MSPSKKSESYPNVSSEFFRILSRKNGVEQYSIIHTFNLLLTTSLQQPEIAGDSTYGVSQCAGILSTGTPYLVLPYTSAFNHVISVNLHQRILFLMVTNTGIMSSLSLLTIQVYILASSSFTPARGGLATAISVAFQLIFLEISVKYHLVSPVGSHLMPLRQLHLSPPSPPSPWSDLKGAIVDNGSEADLSLSRLLLLFPTTTVAISTAKIAKVEPTMTLICFTDWPLPLWREESRVTSCTFQQDPTIYFDIFSFDTIFICNESLKSCMKTITVRESILFATITILFQ